MSRYILDCGIEITATAEQAERWNDGQSTEDDAKEMIIHLPTRTSNGLPANLDMTIAEYERLLDAYDDTFQQNIIPIS